MEMQQLLTGSRWDLLEEIAKRPSGTSELAEKLKTSPANVSQQLRQLEIAGLVSRRRTARKGVHYVYEIAQDFLHIIRLAPHTATKSTVALDARRRFIGGLLLHPHGYPVMTLMLAHPDLFDSFLAVGVLDRAGPEIFVLAEDVAGIRQHHANVTVKTAYGDKQVAIWSHTPAELTEGLAKQETYFVQASEEMGLVYDPQGRLAKILADWEETRK